MVRNCHNRFWCALTLSPWGIPGALALSRLFRTRRWRSAVVGVNPVADVRAALALWTVGADGAAAKKVLDDATGFDWYLDSRRGVYTRYHGSESEMVAVDLETGEERSLFVGPFIEMDVAPDGSAVAFTGISGRGKSTLAAAWVASRKHEVALIDADQITSWMRLGDTSAVNLAFAEGPTERIAALYRGNGPREGAETPCRYSGPRP